MKKIFYLASIAALAFSSCAKDETTEAQIGAVNGGSKITAAMAADETRTSLDENQKFRWSAGDQLGVYTVDGGLNNAAFVLDNASDGSAVGVFASQSAKLSADKKYVAVYPRFQEGLFTETINTVEWDNPAGADATPAKIKYPNYETVKVKIPAKQKYQDASVYTQTVPAVSTTFVVDENGAQVSMQPVVDYLFVNIQSVEPINTLTLTLRKDRNATWIPIAGTGNLSKYILDKEYRYALLNENLTDSATEITLQIDEAAAEVMCHESNTYVFTIPAGILGMGGTVEAGIEVNKGQSNAIKFDAVDPSAINGDKKRVTNEHLNGYKVKENGSWTTKNRKKDGKFVMRQENTVFWMNPLNDKGERTTFTYNPKNTVLIENEGDLLLYLTNYNASTNANDALVCNEHTFDFSVSNIQKLSNALVQGTEAYTKYNTVYTNYLKGSFPTINGQYKNSFRGMEHNGKVTVITGIERTLASEDGIFGNNITGSIENVEFSDIVAKSTKVANPSYYKYGNILGSVTTGSIKNVTVENAVGAAIFGEANVAAYKQLTVKDVDQLNFIVNKMNLEGDLEIKNWAVASSVATSVFGTIDAMDNANVTGTDSHHVVTLPAGAAYEDLALYIGVDDNTGIVAGVGTADAATWISYYISGALNGVPSIDVEQTDLNVVSVLIGDVSYWTGDKFPINDAGFYNNPKHALAKYDKKTVLNAGTDYEVNVNGWSKAEYAEQLATGGWNSNAEVFFNVVIQRDMDLTKTDMLWEQVAAYKVEGQGKTIKGIYMEAIGGSTPVAPMNVHKLNNLKFDGISIDVITSLDGVDYTVPTAIGGLTLNTRFISNVSVKNLALNAYGINGTDYTEPMYPDTPVYIGWLAATATDPVIENTTVEGVNNAIIGVTGLVGKANLSAGAYFKNSSASNVTAVQSAIADHTEVGAINAVKANKAGTVVGAVFNNSGAAQQIKFEGVGNPAFLFYAPSTIVVNNIGVGTKNLNNKTGNYKYDYTQGNGAAWAN